MLIVLCIAGCAHEVQFDDPNLEAAVRATIGKTKGAITDRDLRKITKLEAPDNNIRDITGIEKCVNLEVLVLGATEGTGWKTSNKVEDFSPLKGLTKLVYLNLNSSKISDCGTLTDYRNVISDVTPLSNLTSLKVLYLGNNQITDPSPLANLKDLETLDLRDNPVNDLTFLANLTNLTSLFLAGTGIDNDDLKFPSNVTNLTHLELDGNQISDIDPLTHLAALESLKLGDNQISDISPISNLTNLTVLELYGNQIRDLSMLSGLDKLNKLNLYGNMIGDITPLVENRGLGENDEVDLEGNSLNDAAYETHIPALEKRGVRLSFDEEKSRIQLWDTLSAPAPVEMRDQVHQNNSGWKIIPAGTSYSPQGSIVLENGFIAAAFRLNSGRVMIYSKSGEKRAELVPLRLKDKPAKITACKVLENTSDKANIEVSFADAGTNERLSAVFSFGRDRIVQVAPAKGIKGMSILSPMEYGILPSFISDDLIFKPEDYPQTDELYIPSENLFVGLLSGEGSMLGITWPDGGQKVKLALDNGNIIESVDLENDGKSFHLAILDAPGIWHKEELKPSYLHKDVAIDWKRPYPAKWITQLYEDRVKTTYTFIDFKPEGFWRAGIGWCAYPVRFDGKKAVYSLSKKLPPKGESIIYSLERENTPASVPTFVDIMKQTLDSHTYESIIDPQGRMTRSLTRPNCAIGNATCHVTDRLKLVFEAGEEVEKQDYIKSGTEDMVYFLTKQQERVLEYQQFAHDMIDFLALMKKDRPESRTFIERIEGIAGELISEYEYEKENIKDSEYVRTLVEETQELTQRQDPGNIEAFIKIKDKWTGMGSAVDDLNRKLHTITRKLFQEAGYRCTDQPETVRIAEEIRKRTIQCLRNPGRFEIWANY